MAFKNPPIEAIVPESPDRLFRDLTRRRLPDVLPHQAEIMRKYTAEALERPDVALQLPTGSGKTLVGLLVAEWRRRKFRERIVSFQSNFKNKMDHRADADSQAANIKARSK